MKRFTFIVLLLTTAGLFASCSSVSFRQNAFEPGAGEFISNEVSKKFFSDTFSWRDYTLKMKAKDNGIEKITIGGVGKKKGTIIQKGILNKNGSAVRKVEFRCDVDGVVVDDEKGSNLFSIEDESLTLTIDPDGSVYNLTGKNDYSFECSNMSVKFSAITKYVTEHGKEYDMAFGASAGIKVEVDGEYYALMDFMGNAIKINPYFSVDFSDEQETELTALLLSIYYYNKGY